MIPYTINPPESDVFFEELCLAILKRHWNRPGLERFAKKGEGQYGVDIFDTLAESPLYAAQCKLKEQWKSLGPAQIREEIAKAETFPAKIDHYAIMTTGKVSGIAQLTIQQINQEHRASGTFTVELFTWEKITNLLRQYSEIERQFYSGVRSDEVVQMTSKLDLIFTSTKLMASSAIASDIDRLIDEARERIHAGEPQLAVLLLNQIRRTKGEHLTDWHRFRIHTNFGAAYLMIGNGKEAARSFLDAAPLRPDDELAVANEVLAYHLLLQEDTTREKAEDASKRFPNSTRIRALLIQSASPETPYNDLREATPAHMRTDAEVASALSRRALMAGLIDTGIKHAEAAVADKPDWAHAHLLLAQAHFGRVAAADRINVPADAQERESHLASALRAADLAIVSAKSAELADVR